MLKKIKEYLLGIRIFSVLPYLAAASALMALVGIVYAVTESRSHWLWIASVLLYLTAALTYCHFLRYRTIGTSVPEQQSFLSGMTLDLIVKMPDPVLICNEAETILWYNGAFSDKLGKKNITGLRFEQFSDHSLSELLSSSGEGLRITLDDRHYLVNAYTFSSKSKHYYLTHWKDNTEKEQLLTRLTNEETQVAYLMIDNLEEIAQYAKESTRSAANEIEKVLSDWADSHNGILKEYQTNRYLFLLHASVLAECIERKFDILDRIREIRVGDGNLSVTVSMGISSVSECSLSEKERIAGEALDMALQRGGDQAVVKSAKGLEFFGGKTQTVQKRTKVRSRVIANELAARIARSSNVLIMGHRAPDFDCIGACLGVARLCAYCGVPFYVVANTKDENFKKCYARIAEIAEYRGATVFRNEAEAQELLDSDTLTIIVDVNNKSQLEAPSIAEISHRTVYIDHHRKTAEFDEAPLISYIEPSASSACELVAEILEQALPSGMLYKEEADIMYSGILLDTKQFTKNAGVRTFGAALYLRGEGANPTDALTLFKSGLSDFISEARFESNVVLYRRCMAISCNDSPDNTSSDRISAAKAADKLLTVEGVLASFALCRIDDVIHVSARSTGEINVQLILERLGGGGHFDAAATQLVGSMNDALSRLKDAIDEYFTNDFETKT